MIRRTCRRLLADLDIRPPVAAEEICARYAARRGRPILVLEREIPVPGAFGMWLAADRADYILYLPGTTRAHQNHVILHEFGHLLCRHEGHALTRGLSADSREEREAELFASTIMEWAMVADRLPPLTPAGALTGDLESALLGRPGWL